MGKKSKSKTTAPPPEEIKRIRLERQIIAASLSMATDLWEIQPDGSSQLAPPLKPDGTPDHEARNEMLKILQRSNATEKLPGEEDGEDSDRPA